MRLLAWYLISAGLIIALLAPWLMSAESWATRTVILSGIGLQVLAIGCGISTDSGACDKSDGLPHVAIGVLLAAGLIAEIVHRLEASEWRRKKNCSGHQA